MSCEEVFGGDTERFEEGDIGCVPAAFFCAAEDFAELCPDVGLGEEAFVFWDEEFAGFLEE